MGQNKSKGRSSSDATPAPTNPGSVGRKLTSPDSGAHMRLRKNSVAEFVIISRDGNQQLPRELFYNVMKRLQFPDVLRCREVCSEWDALIDNNWFWAVYYEYHWGPYYFSAQEDRGPKELAAASYRMDREAPDSLADFELLQVLHTSATTRNGRVLKVRRNNNDKIYALKEVTPITPVIVGSDSIRVWRRLVNPFIAKHYFCFQTPEAIYFQMELVEGLSLARRLDDLRRLPEDEARFYAGSIFMAMNYLHKNEISMVRSLTMERILIGRAGYIKVSVAACVDWVNDLNPEVEMEASSAWRHWAPEYIATQEPTMACDIWAFGSILHELLFGVPPHSAASLRQLASILGDIGWEPGLLEDPSAEESVSQSAQALIGDCLSLVADDRPRDSAIKKHKFFKGLVWGMLERQQMEAPFRPLVPSTSTPSFDFNGVEFGDLGEAGPATTAALPTPDFAGDFDFDLGPDATPVDDGTDPAGEVEESDPFGEFTFVSPDAMKLDAERRRQR